ncbi:hypothetical protein [Sporosarcina sp. P33]|uniref:hypothetical protein n=1 Tax=Sporosarcina sp. P33 TaxID=1930764 RepID=UPI0009BD5B02|nr:hypothetical protein [Sporosarcina sp. P33]ARD47581.1 hypothetical protein SporoP33_04565 [Sporosarcina sp. P33]
MKKQLFEKVGTSRPDNLIADISFPLQTGSGVIKAAAGPLLRGTLLGKDTGGELVMASSTVEADCILADNVVVGEEAETVVTYISGAFAIRELIAENDVMSHQEALRTKGIYIKATVGGE